MYFKNTLGSFKKLVLKRLKGIYFITKRYKIAKVISINEENTLNGYILL